MAEDTRVSYRPAGLPEDAPVVWFFGGSTMFGEGQRDEHTIPSEVARLAEDAGTPVRVVNFGQRGWVIWQELLQLDQQLAVREAPDLVVFYDGTNEVNVMAEQGGNQPTVYNADDLRATFEGGAVTDAGEVAEEQPLDEAIFEVWRDTSLVGEIAREARQVLSVAPAAAGEVPDPGADPREVVDEAVAVYQRARDRVIDLTERHDVETLFFWQPKAESTTSPDGPMRTAARLVGSPTIDLSLALSSVPGDQVFIDGGHTNELGALLVAQAMWPYIESQVVAPAEGGSGGS
jgi:lysophospholipase L1-like esterase